MGPISRDSLKFVLIVLATIPSINHSKIGDIKEDIMASKVAFLM